jgi:hypothetical protein
MLVKAVLFLTALATGCLSAWAEDITFTYKIASFTNLEGRAYKNVRLIKADDDGLIWRQEASGGRICYTNLHPDVLEWLGIPTDRIEIARERAGHKAIADKRYQAVAMAKAEAELRMRPPLTNATPVSSYGVLGGPPLLYSSGAAYSSDFAYNPMYALSPWYPGVYLVGPRAASAPSAPSAPSHPSIPSTLPAPRGLPGSVPTAILPRRP